MPFNRLTRTSLLVLAFLSFGVAPVMSETVAPSFRPPRVAGVAAPSMRAPSLNTFQRQNIRRYLSGQAATLDTLRLLALQVQFADTLISADRDSTFFANELKHLQQYFEGASRGQLDIAWRVSARVYNLPERMRYYGVDDLEEERVVEMMQTVIDSADADEDFSRFDTVMLIHGGPGQETDILDNSRDQLFSTFLDAGDIDAVFPDSVVLGLATGDSLDGQPFFVNNFMVVPERATQDGQTIATLGIWAFLTGSRLGLIPLFDSTPAGFPDSRGVGDFDLMSNGLFNVNGFVPGFPCAFNRALAGWVDPINVASGGDFRLHDINVPAANDTACLRIPITESEYYLVVNRVHDTNFDSLFTFADLDSDLVPDNTDSLGGAEFDWWLTDLTNPFVVKFDPVLGINRRFVTTGSGLYIWHVDEAVIRQNIDAGFLPNDFVSRKGVDLEEADGVPDLDNSLSGFSFGSHFDSFRAGHNDRFGPGTKPASDTNTGSRTGLVISNISAPDSFMTLTIAFSRPFTDVRTRWRGVATFQPPTLFDLDGAGPREIVALADSAGLYAFSADGSEFVDADVNPSTVDPYIAAPGAVWLGAPAFGDIDGGGDEEIVAFTATGTVYAWKGDGSEVFDGDANAATIGVLYQGLPLAAPPMLVDVDDDAIEEIAIVERDGDELEISFVDGSGAKVLPSDSDIRASHWPARFDAQSCSPLAYGALGTSSFDTEGVAVVWADTARTLNGFWYFPVRKRTGVGSASSFLDIAPRGELSADFPAASAPAIGDLDGNGFDELVFTLADGRLVIHSATTPFDATAPVTPAKATRFVDLRAAHPSSPALGDVDGDGTLEIAVWDDAHFYLFENNGRLSTGWPRPLREGKLGSFPPLTFDAALNSPLIGDLDGGDRGEILFPTREGTVYGFHADGSVVGSFPRPAPAAAGATPLVADVGGDGELEFVAIGSVPLIGTFDSVSDTIVPSDQMVLSIQSLPGSDATAKSFWLEYQQDTRRRGRVTESNPLLQTGDAIAPNSFIIYPNPVRGDEVHARIVLNRSASVRVEIYNLEGERALERRFAANPAGVVQTPFDETIDLSGLESGVYLMRLSVSGADTLVKTFAILR